MATAACKGVDIIKKVVNPCAIERWCLSRQTSGDHRVAANRKSSTCHHRLVAAVGRKLPNDQAPQYPLNAGRWFFFATSPNILVGCRWLHEEAVSGEAVPDRQPVFSRCLPWCQSSRSFAAQLQPPL